VLVRRRHYYQHPVRRGYAGPLLRLPEIGLLERKGPTVAVDAQRKAGGSRAGLDHPVTSAGLPRDHLKGSCPDIGAPEDGKGAEVLNAPDVGRGNTHLVHRPLVVRNRRVRPGDQVAQSGLLPGAQLTRSRQPKQPPDAGRTPGAHQIACAATRHTATSPGGECSSSRVACPMAHAECAQPASRAL